MREMGNFYLLLMVKTLFKLIKKYGVTQGHTVFKITNTNIEAEMLIVAKSVEVQIKK